MTVKDAALYLNISTSLIRRYCRTNRLDATKHGRDWQIWPSSVYAFRRTTRTAGRPRKAVEPPDQEARNRRKPSDSTLILERAHPATYRSPGHPLWLTETTGQSQPALESMAKATFPGERCRIRIAGTNLVVWSN